MEANGLKRGLLFTADPYSKVIDPGDKDTAMLFGDAAAVTLLGEVPAWNAGKFVFGSRGAEREAIRVNEDGRLNINGRAVFTFAATEIPGSIREAVELNGLSLSDVNRVILHQSSRYIVDTIRIRLGLEEEKVPFVAAAYGNTVSSSISIALEALDDTVKTVVISGFGVGLSWASGVLTRAG